MHRLFPAERFFQDFEQTAGLNFIHEEFRYWARFVRFRLRQIFYGAGIEFNFHFIAEIGLVLDARTFEHRYADVDAVAVKNPGVFLR